MKNKLLSIFLAIILFTTLLTGCNAKTNRTAEDDFETIVDSDVTTEFTETKSKIEDEVIDWSTAYDNYFDENLFLRNNAQMSTTITNDNYTMVVIVAVSGDTSRILYDINGINNASLDIYVTPDKAYGKTILQGQTFWRYAPINSPEDAIGLIGINTTNESIKSCTYVKELTENNIVYDVLDTLAINNGTEDHLFCYINRETQKMDKYTVTQDEREFVYILEDIEGIEIPTEAESGTESTVKEINSQLVTIILSAAGLGSEE